MSPPRLESPLQWVGGYVLHLYCDRDVPEFSHTISGEYGGNTSGEAKAEARMDGWKIRNDGTATCPVCADKMEGPPARS